MEAEIRLRSSGGQRLFLCASRALHRAAEHDREQHGERREEQRAHRGRPADERDRNRAHCARQRDHDALVPEPLVALLRVFELRVTLLDAIDHCRVLGGGPHGLSHLLQLVVGRP